MSNRTGSMFQVSGFRLFPACALLFTLLLCTVPLPAEIAPPLTVEMYDITDKDPGDSGWKGLPEDILGKRARWRTHDYADIAKINTALAPLNYQFSSNALSYDFKHGDELILGKVTHAALISMSASARRFLLYVRYKAEGRETGAMILDGEITEEMGLGAAGNFEPGFIGEKVLYIDCPYHSPERIEVKVRGKSEFKDHCSVLLDERPIFKKFFIYTHEPSLKAFFSQNGHWIMEHLDATIEKDKDLTYFSTAVVDGIDIKEKYGHESVFNYFYLAGEPFYFFVDRSGKTRISHGGKTLRYKFDEVKHYGCCSESAYIPEWNNHMIWFFATKGDRFYYVEAGIYPEHGDRANSPKGGNE